VAERHGASFLGCGKTNSFSLLCCPFGHAVCETTRPRAPMRFIHILGCPVEEIKIDNRTLRGVARYQPAPRERSLMSVILPKIKPEKESSRLRCLGDSSGDENSSQRLREAPFCFRIFLPATRSRTARRNFSRTHHAKASLFRSYLAMTVLS
jgi:hypothetical protein